MLLKLYVIIAWKGRQIQHATKLISALRLAFVLFPFNNFEISLLTIQNILSTVFAQLHLCTLISYPISQ